MRTAGTCGKGAVAKTGWPGCQDNVHWLAAEFIRRVDAGESVRHFFGSWYDLQGYTQTGYFLGSELLRRVGVKMSMTEIALLDQEATVLRSELEKLAIAIG